MRKVENKSIFYSIKDKSVFKGKTVSIFGGGDSALDWAIELSKDSKVNLIHRRDEFRGAQATVDKMNDLAKNTEKFETNQKGIYAGGVICTYPGKLKLILSGFHEGALAARACFKLARPNEKYRFEFTTTSTSLLKRLGKKK